MNVMQIFESIPRNLEPKKIITSILLQFLCIAALVAAAVIFAS